MVDNYFARFFHEDLCTTKQISWLTSQDLWPLVQELCRKSGMQLKVVKIYDVPQGVVTLGLRAFGAMPVLQLYQKSDDSFVVKNWHRELKAKGHEKYTLKSKNWKSLMRKLVKGKEDSLLANMMGSTLVCTLGHLRDGAYRVSTHVDEEFEHPDRNNTVTIPWKPVNQALAVIFDGADVQSITPASLTTLKEWHEKLRDKAQRRMDCVAKMEKELCGEHLVIGKSDVGYIVGGVTFTVDSLRANGCKITQPFKLFKSLEAMAEKAPELHADVMGQLTMLKVHLETRERMQYVDRQRYFPRAQEYFDEIGVFACYGSMSSDVAYPQWLVINRG